MEATVFTIGGICMLLLLFSGTVLTFITIRRMITGQICLPGWAKVLLTCLMLLMLLCTLLSMLPPARIGITNIFITEDTHIVLPAIPETTATP